MNTTRQQLTEQIQALPVAKLRGALLAWAQSSHELSVEALVAVLTDRNAAASNDAVGEGQLGIFVQEESDLTRRATEDSETNPELLAENADWLRKEAEVGLRAYREGDFDDITSPENQRRVLREIRDSAKAEANARLSDENP